MNKCINLCVEGRDHFLSGLLVNESGHCPGYTGSASNEGQCAVATMLHDLMFIIQLQAITFALSGN